MFEKTIVSSGTGKVLIFSKGRHSFVGQLLEMVRPLDSEGNSIGETTLSTVSQKLATMRRVFLIAALAISLVMSLFPYFEPLILGKTLSKTEYIMNSWVEAFQVCFSLQLIASLPGLHTFLTLTLALTVRRLLQDSVLVRKLQAVEELPYIDTIMTEKTGCMTENKMSVMECWVGEMVRVKQPFSNFNEFIIPSFRDLFEKILCCTLTKESESPSDQAVRRYLEQCGSPIDKVFADNRAQVIEKFTSDNKMATFQVTDPTGTSLKIVRGASEKLLTKSDSFRNLKTGELVDLNNEHERQKIEAAIRSAGEQGYRTLAIAYAAPEQDNLCFGGFLCIRDTLKMSTSSAIDTCHSAGIQVKMVSGDNDLNCRITASEAGMLSHPFAASASRRVFGYNDDLQSIHPGNLGLRAARKIRGDEFDHEDEDSPPTWDTVAVFARSTPDRINKIATILQHEGRSVAVIGDGTNMAPALSSANVGFGLGISGTDTAKQASDMIIMDDSFSSVVKAITWGRFFLYNVKAGLLVMLNFGISAGVLIAFSSFFYQEPVISLIQLLFTAMVVDILTFWFSTTVGCRQLSTDLGLVTKTQSILNQRDLKFILFEVITQVIIIGYFMNFGYSMLPDPLTADSRLVTEVAGRKYVTSGTFNPTKSGQGWSAPNSLIPSRHYTYLFAIFFCLQLTMIPTTFKYLGSQGVIGNISKRKTVLALLIIWVLLFFVMWFFSAPLRLAEGGLHLPGHCLVILVSLASFIGLLA